VFWLSVGCEVVLHSHKSRNIDPRHSCKAPTSQQVVMVTDHQAEASKHR